MDAQTQTQSETTKKEIVVNSVKMEDGRTVDFVGKRSVLKDSFQDQETGAIGVRFDFSNGKTLTYTIPESLVAKFAAHGAEQKLGDEMAGLADIDDKFLAVEKLMGRLKGPDDWSVQREAGGMAGTSILLRALVEHTGKTPEQIKAFLDGKNQAEKIALRANPKIKPIIERLEAEKAQKGQKVDTDAMLNELA